MRVLFEHPFPFSLAHGGFQTQIEQTMASLNEIGVEAEPLRWWDDTQRGDLIHYFGRPSGPYIEAAHRKGMKVVVAEILTGTASRSMNALRAQRAFIALSKRLLPASFRARMAWEAYQLGDAFIANTKWESYLMRYLFNAEAEKVHIVTNGIEAPFFEAKPAPRGEWLVSTATITERKRVVELANAAAQAKTPVWIIGKPYAASDPYALQFAEAVKNAGGVVRYEGPVSDRSALASIYRAARGFVLLSSMETLSFSALEASACGCPLLLSDLPWARTSFGDHVSYCPVTTSTAATAQCLRRFYDAAPALPAPPRPATWPEVAREFRRIYEILLKTSL